ncbi:MAG: hypothetical protein JWO30_3285 [Fibrobacteres bacterium]|nr:hypothetical protein [Fibrobacterota bacterium]
MGIIFWPGMEKSHGAPAPVNIFSFVDFKRFLAEAYEWRAGSDDRFTKTSICRQMGLPNSRSFFSDIIAGKKQLSKAKMELLIPIFGLDGDEAQYFRFLVLYNQTVVKDEREFYLDQLIALNRTPWMLVDRSAYEYYREWYTSAIRAYLDIADISDEHEKIAKALYPPVTVPQVKASMELLKRLNFIRQDKRGFWKPGEKILFSKSDANDALVKRYQAKCIELGLPALYDPDLQPKTFVTRTLSVSSDIYVKIEKKLQKFLSEVRSLVHKDEKPADRLCQLNIQLFPQARTRP